MEAQVGNFFFYQTVERQSCNTLMLLLVAVTDTHIFDAFLWGFATKLIYASVVL